MKDKRKKIKKKIEELEEEILRIGEDFNTRIGREGKRCEVKIK